MKKKDKRIYIIISLITILIFSMIYYYINNSSTLNKYKDNKHKLIVYSVYNKDKNNVPNINLKTKEIDVLNDVIIDKANNFLKGDNNVTYDFEINGKILSLSIQYIDYYDKSGYPKISYDVYNINYENGKILDNDYILSLYNVDENDVYNIISSKFGDYYNDLAEKKYIMDDECDYNCYLELRGIEDDNYLENVHYYIKNGNLYAIRAFNIFSFYDEDKYFTTDSFLFQITK